MNNLRKPSVETIETAIVTFMRHGGAYFGELESHQLAGLLRELLARRAAAERPVAYIDSDELERLADNDSGVVRTPNFGSGYQSATIPLYTATPLPVVPEGWALVPIDATMDMLKEGAKQNMRHEPFQSVWKAMLAAAPKPPATENK